MSNNQDSGGSRSIVDGNSMGVVERFAMNVACRVWGHHPIPVSIDDENVGEQCMRCWKLDTESDHS